MGRTHAERGARLRAAPIREKAKPCAVEHAIGLYQLLLLQRLLLGSEVALEGDLRISLSRNLISTNESCDKGKEVRQVGSEDTFLSVTKYLSDIYKSRQRASGSCRI